MSTMLDFAPIWLRGCLVWQRDPSYPAHKPHKLLEVRYDHHRGAWVLGHYDSGVSMGLLDDFGRICTHRLGYPAQFPRWRGAIAHLQRRCRIAASLAIPEPRKGLFAWKEDRVHDGTAQYPEPPDDRPAELLPEDFYAL